MNTYCKKLFKRKIPAMAAIMLVFSFAFLVNLTGCSAKAASIRQTENEKLNVVATTTMLYDLTAIIGGEHIQATALMGPGIDPHLYQASAGDVKKMQAADIVVYNGLHLEGKMGDVFAALTEQGRDVICAQQGIEQSLLLADASNPDVYDPHIWFDVSIWMQVAEHISERLAEIDPKHAQIYTENMQKYQQELEQLDQYIAGRVQELPKAQRVLITAHDAFRYFGEAYGFQVKGLQGISTDAQAGTADVSALAEFIAHNRIKAIFVESSVPPKDIQALQEAVKAKGFAVQIGGELYSDSLGDAASENDTYLATCKANIDTIIDALK